MSKTNEKNFGKLLGKISDSSLQSALDEFDLGQLVSSEAIPFGLFGQNAFLESTSGSYVLRTCAFYDWQLPTEHFFSKLIHPRTQVPAPWPYLLSESEIIFGFQYGFAIMPRLPGITTADPETYKSFNSSQKSSLAMAQGTALRELQKLTNDVSGKYDHIEKAVIPFPNGYVARTVERIRKNVATSIEYPNPHISQTDKDWIDSTLADAAKLSDDFQPVIVHEDFNRNNMTVEQGDNDNWQITGLFDLMTAHFGDGLADIPRQFSMYIEEGLLTVAEDYIKAYLDGATLDAEAKQRLELYLIDDRLLIWQYFHRPNHDRSRFDEKSGLKEWLSPFLDVLHQIID